MHGPVSAARVREVEHEQGKLSGVLTAGGTGQTHVQKYTQKLLQMILDGKIDTTFLISHRLPLEKASEGYKMFKEQQNEVTKVVLKPGMTAMH